MSEQHHEVQELHFTIDEINQFDADDAQAGAAIGKMLTLFFVYTIIAMTLCVGLTWRWVSMGSPI